MRILRNILLLILPLAIFVNLYRYIVVGQVGDSFEYRGFHFFFEYFSTFNGLKHTIDTLNLIKENVLSFTVSYTEVTDLASFFVAFGNYFKIVGCVLMLPIWILTDIILDIIWFTQMFMQ